MDHRRAFVDDVTVGGTSISAACRAAGISRPTGYRWLREAAASPDTTFADRSHRPHQHPHQTSSEVVTAILIVRDAHPDWGARKLREVLLRQGTVTPVPAASTITEVLRREGRLTSPRAGQPRAFVRFERAAPNELWQMDHLGHRALQRGGRVHPLTIIDDHSRLLIGLTACASERLMLVQAALTVAFQAYGLPRTILADNGTLWGGPKGTSQLEVWLYRLDIELIHGRPYHPQTQGKVERVHSTIRRACDPVGGFRDLMAAQAAFDAFRACSNTERPHEALRHPETGRMLVPAQRYTVSDRPFPERLREWAPGPGEVVRIVSGRGTIGFGGEAHYVGEAYRTLPVILSPAGDGTMRVRLGERELLRIARDPEQLPLPKPGVTDQSGPV